MSLYRRFFSPFFLIIALFLSSALANLQAAEEKETFKPFILAKNVSMTMDKAKDILKKQITKSPFSVVAEYQPYDNAYVFIITNDELKSLLSKEKYGGFAAGQRLALTAVDNTIQISYTNPVFMQHAYRLKSVDLTPFLAQMKEAFGFEDFFGGEGLTARKLARYKYSFGLEDFDSFYELPEYDSHVEAIAELVKGFNKKENGITEVYKIKIPGKEQVVFGIHMNGQDSGDEALDLRKTMDIIDHLPLKRTAYLPYEILVDGNNIYAMHARFRIAVNFSDLKMFGKHGFGKLFSTPTSYQKAFMDVAGADATAAPVTNGFID